MKIRSEELIQDLIERTRQNINQAELLKIKTDNALNYKAASQSWSALECLEHLNLYGRFYLPEIAKQIEQSRYPKETDFKSGLLGNYFANSLLPKEKLNKMNTFKSMNPLNSELDISVIDNFLDQQIQMLELLNKARHVSLNKTKAGISISSLIKLKLGDTFRVVIYHNQRHIQQAEKAREASKNS
ncbi:DinB family protein [Flavobacterium cerinum]|uniref:DinB family protein n=1 Tax=Flavobacterium cerinum TaxID=2502784 RepID=A0A3S3SEI9_9FLAO|nr:DinB family protein [Flavobacterium cerinum]RWX00234.1 DinB family protein [Flavobacterium cerinum]